MKEEENKYYTPSIDEFYVGFEFEYKMDDGLGNYNWLDFTFNNSANIKQGFIFSIDNIFEDIKEEYIRVKYLNKEDIESLGWKVWPNREYIFDLESYQLHQDRIPENNKIKGIEIYNNNDKIIFEGYLKNKSELKKLMQQLNIL